VGSGSNATAAAAITSRGRSGTQSERPKPRYRWRIAYQFEDLDDGQFERVVVQCMRKLFGAGSGEGLAPIAKATGLGAASSSCSDAAIGKSLFQKGASAVIWRPSARHTPWGHGERRFRAIDVRRTTARGHRPRLGFSRDPLRAFDRSRDLDA
jgi:hypothetical protein